MKFLSNILISFLILISYLNGQDNINEDLSPCEGYSIKLNDNRIINLHWNREVDKILDSLKKYRIEYDFLGQSEGLLSYTATIDNRYYILGFKYSGSASHAFFEMLMIFYDKKNSESFKKIKNKYDFLYGRPWNIENKKTIEYEIKCNSYKLLHRFDWIKKVLTEHILFTNQ